MNKNDSPPPAEGSEVSPARKTLRTSTLHKYGLLDRPPHDILMIKAYSAGIGDLLRSSAAWRALKTAFPETRLHLLFLSNKEPGYPSEELIGRHHLLTSFRAVSKRHQGVAGWKQFFHATGEYAAACHPDLIIDFERHGLRTSFLSRWLGMKHHAATLGVSQFALRNLLYQFTSVSVDEFARQRDLPVQLNYTDRDFVALSALGIERRDTPIELCETEESRAFQLEIRHRYRLSDTTRLLGLNIGSGSTKRTLRKRPPLPLLSKLVAHLQTQHELQLVLTGAEYEAGVNREFIQLHRQNHPASVIDLAGQMTILQLTGVIQACDLFVSGDSGPYHMAVALRVPTLAVFMWDNWQHYHQHPWVRCVWLKNFEDPAPLISAADELWQERLKKKT